MQSSWPVWYVGELLTGSLFRNLTQRVHWEGVYRSKSRPHKSQIRKLNLYTQELPAKSIPAPIDCWYLERQKALDYTSKGARWLRRSELDKGSFKWSIVNGFEMGGKQQEKRTHGTKEMFATCITKKRTSDSESLLK